MDFRIMIPQNFLVLLLVLLTGFLKTSVNKVQGDPGPSMGKGIVMQPIGVVHSPYKEIKGTPIQGVFAKDSEPG